MQAKSTFYVVPSSSLLCIAPAYVRESPVFLNQQVQPDSLVLDAEEAYAPPLACTTYSSYENLATSVVGN